MKLINFQSADYFTTSRPVSDDELKEFIVNSGLTSLSTTFIKFCLGINGCYPGLQIQFYYPPPVYEAYWQSWHGDGLPISGLEGITSEPKFSILRWTENARRVWGVPCDLWQIATTDGAQIVCPLVEGNDPVYLWDKHFDPPTILIASSLAEFYENLGPERDVSE